MTTTEVKLSNHPPFDPFTVDGDIIQDGDTAVGVSGELFKREGANWKLAKNSIKQEKVVKTILYYISEDMAKRIEDPNDDITDDIETFVAALVSFSENKAIFRTVYKYGYYKEKYELMPKMNGNFPNQIYYLYMSFRIMRFYIGKLLDDKLIKHYLEKNNIDSLEKLKKKFLGETQRVFDNDVVNTAFNIYFKDIYFSADYKPSFKTYNPKGKLNDLILKLPSSVIVENHKYFSSVDLTLFVDSRIFEDKPSLEIMVVNNIIPEHTKFENDEKQILKFFEDFANSDDYGISWVKNYVDKSAIPSIVILFVNKYPQEINDNMFKLVIHSGFDYLKYIVKQEWCDQVRNERVKTLIRQLDLAYDFKVTV